LLRFRLPGEVAGLDVLEDDDLIAIYQLSGLFLLKALTLACNLAMRFADEFLGAFPSMRSTLRA
jgi:hypothetical protein